MPMSIPPELLYQQCLCPPVSHSSPPAPTSTADPPIPAGRSDPHSNEVTGFFPPGPGAHKTNSDISLTFHSIIIVLYLPIYPGLMNWKTCC